MPEWLPIVAPIAACVAIVMAMRLMFRDRQSDMVKASAERKAEMELSAAIAEKRGASNTELAQSMTALRMTMATVTTEISGLKTLATEMLKVNFELAHVKTAVESIRDDMKLLADAERVHATLDDLDRRLRELEQHMSKWSGRFGASSFSNPSKT